MKKSNLLTLSAIASMLLFNGCANDKDLLEDKVVIYEANDINADELSEDKLIGLESDSKSHTYIDRSEIIIDEGEEVYPPRELLDMVDATSFEGQKLIDVIKLLTSDFKETSVFLEPNINANLQIHQRVGKMSVYEVIKSISKRLGYNAYYNEKERALVISPYVTRKYQLPSGIFVKQKVEQKMGAKGGNTTASIDLNSDDPAKVFEDSLDKLGSSDKLVNFDKNSGMLTIKEHPHLVKELDNYVVEFVKDRSRKFIVEIAIFDVVMNNDEKTGFNISELSYGMNGRDTFSATNLSGDGSVGLSHNKQRAYDQTSGSWTQVLGTDGFKFSAALNMMKTKKNMLLVDKSKTVIANHDVNYIANGITKSYVSAIQATPQQDGDPVVTKTMDKVFDGVGFVSRVDGFQNKDYIEVSLAPSVNSVEIIKGRSSLDEDLVEEQLTETISKVNIKSGELIVLGGLVRDSKTETKSVNPYLENVPLLGDMFQQNSGAKYKIETVFLVQVTELNDIKQTYDIPTYQMKDKIEQSY